MSIFWRLVWKEYRVQRPLWLALSAVGLLVYLICAVELWFSRQDPHEWGFIPGAILLVYMVASATILFALEREEKTDEFLRNVAAPPFRLVAAKLLFLLASAIVLLITQEILFCALVDYTHLAQLTRNREAFLAIVWFLAIVSVLLLTAVFVSLCSRRVVHAVAMTVVLGVLQFLLPPILHGVLVVCVLGSLPFLVDRWLIEPRDRPRWFRLHLSFPRWSRTQAAVPQAATAGDLAGPAADLLVSAADSGPAGTAVVPGTIPQPGRVSRTLQAGLRYRFHFEGWGAWLCGDRLQSVTGRQFGRLVWQEFRQARLAMFLITTVGLLLVGFTYLPSGYGVPVGMRQLASTASSLVILISIFAIPNLAGSLSFEREGAGQRFRFLAEKGISPSLVWLSKHTVWLTFAVLLSGVLLLGQLGSEVANLPKAIHHYDRLIWNVPLYAGMAPPVRLAAMDVHQDIIDIPVTPVFSSTVVMLLLTFLMCYSSSQLVSMITPHNGIVVLALGVGVAVPAVAWVWLMWGFQIPLWWSAFPLVLLLLGLSWRWSQLWMLEQLSRWRLARMAIEIAVPCLAILAGAAAYRAYEIPWIVDPQFDALMASLSVETAEEARTQEDWKKLWDLVPMSVPQRPLEDDEKWGADGWKFTNDKEPEFLEASQPALARAKELASRPVFRIEHPYDRARDPWSGLTLAIRLQARQLEAEGKLDESLDWHLLRIRLACQMAKGQWVSIRRGPQLLLDPNRTGLFEWMSHPDQTAQRLSQALPRITAALDEFPLLSQCCLDTYAAGIAEMELRAEEPIIGDRTTTYLPPWERIRLARLMRRMARDTFLQTRQLEQHPTGLDVNQQMLVTPSVALLWNHMISRAGDRMLLRTLPRFEEPVWAISRQASRNEVLLQMGLAIYRLREGQLPDRLEDLEGVALDELPLDPWTGRNFGYLPKPFELEVKRYQRPDKVELRSPSIWTPGIYNCRLVWVDSTGEYPRYQVRDANGVPVKNSGLLSLIPVGSIGRDGIAGKP